MDRQSLMGGGSTWRSGTARLQIDLFLSGTGPESEGHTSIVNPLGAITEKSWGAKKILKEMVT